MNRPTSRPSVSACSAWTSCRMWTAPWPGCAGHWMLSAAEGALLRLHRRYLFDLQPGETMDGSPQVEQDGHHHDHRRNGNHRIADQGHAPQLGIEGLGTRRA